MILAFDNNEAGMEHYIDKQDMDISSVLLAGENDAPAVQEHLEIIGIQYMEKYIPVQSNFKLVAEKQAITQTGEEETTLSYMVSHDGVYLQIDTPLKPENNIEQTNGELDYGFMDLLPFSLSISYDAQKLKEENEVIDAKRNNATDWKNSIPSRSKNTQFICKICNKQFTSKRSVNRHTRIHKVEKFFNCKLCDAKFTKASALKKHSTTHAIEKTYSCEFCGKTFMRAYSKSLHMRKHTGDRVLQCEYCDANFVDTYSMNRHKRRHMGDRPFMCGECKAGFPTAFDLKRHSYTHSGDRSYSCHVCGTKLKTPYTLKAHIQKHFIEKPHKCEVCGSSFWHTDGLRRHEVSYRCKEFAALPNT